MEEEKQESSEQQEPTKDDQYNEAWQELSASEDDIPEGSEEVESEEVESKELPVEAQDSEEETETETPDIEQRLSETQRWGHELSGKVKELEAKLQQREEGKATQADVDKAQQQADEAQEKLTQQRDGLYEEFPEFKPVLEPLMETIGSLQKKVNELSQTSNLSSEQMARQNALNNFEANVKPKVIEEVPEFDKIVASEDYWQWAGRQRPGLQTAAMYSDNPDDIIWALTEFKKSTSGGEIEAEKQKQKAQKEKRKNIASSPKPGSQSFSNVKTDKSDQSYDDAWNELSAKRDKNGGKLPRTQR